MIKETKDPFLRGDFDSMDMFTRVTVENALLCFLHLVCYTAVFSVVTQRSSGALRHDTKNGCVADYTAPNTKRDSVTPKMTFEVANFYPERPEKLTEKSLETPPQCLGVIDQKWPLVVLDHFSEK